MADETIVEANQTAAAEPASAKPKTRAPRKKAEPKAAAAKPAAKAAKAPKAAKAAPKAVKASTAAVVAPAGRQVKRYTPAERASILASVEKATKGGKITLKAALQQAEVSEQTYYNWKNAAGKTAAPAAAAKASSTSDDLKALVALEAENIKLRKELAAKLRSENTELRKRLGKA
ncbi:putative transposase [Ochrobactrum sp. 19YEA23]|uniref:transposase n=1 Tax=Ochrobactrum sp. 19YEA23 TaxID=3039854 RepID=UPI002479AED4|nr:putative transposase [Ochrobactrum sp. 19YEA23]MDH7787303.1 putative transposase [Ochrobactrum sp. 19YEA23]